MKAYMSDWGARDSRVPFKANAPERVGMVAYMLEGGDVALAEATRILGETEPPVTDYVVNEHCGLSLPSGYGGDWMGLPGRIVGSATIGEQHSVMMADALRAAIDGGMLDDKGVQ